MSGGDVPLVRCYRVPPPPLQTAEETATRRPLGRLAQYNGNHDAVCEKRGVCRTTDRLATVATPKSPMRTRLVMTRPA